MSIVKKVIFVLGIFVFFGLSTEALARYRMDLVDVVVVKNTLNQRDIIEENDLKVIKTSRHLIEEDAILNKDELIGKYIKMEHTLLENQMIREANVESLSEAIDAPHLLLYENQRVYALKKDLVGSVGATLKAGSFVDLAYQFKKEDDYGVLVENVRILGVKDRNGLDVVEGKVPHVVLLALELDDVAIVLKAEEEGKIVLLPRNNNAT